MRNKGKKKKSKFKKYLETFLVVLVIFAAAVSAVVIRSGYQLYKEAVSETPVSQKVEEIQQQEHYTTFDELPQR